MSPLDRHLTTEQLSALLDNQLSPEESEEGYQAHLRTCEQCQQDLAELRQTVRLLWELPQPSLPRSFTLPATFSVTSTAFPTVTQQEQDQMISPAVIPISSRRSGQVTVAPARRRPFQTAMRMVSGLVAVIGLCFVLTGLLGTLKVVSLSTGGTSASSTSTRPYAGKPAARGSSPREGMTPQVSQVPTTTPSIHTAPSAKQSDTTAPGILSIFLFFDVFTLAGQFRLGILLIVLGAIGFSLFRQRKKLYRPQVVSSDHK